MSEVICEYVHICTNYHLKCDKCNFNSNLNIKNYLEIDGGDKHIRYLGDSSD